MVMWLGRYARFIDHLPVRNVAQGAPLGGGSTLHRTGIHPDPYSTKPWAETIYDNVPHYLIG